MSPAKVMEGEMSVPCQRRENLMLELYQFEECEYSAQVRHKMSEWGIDCILRNVSKDKSKAGPSETNIRT